MSDTRISDADIERIAAAVTSKVQSAFHIEEEVHYNSHKRIDVLLDAYESTKNAFWKAFLGLVIVGALVLAGVTAKGWK